MGANQSAGRPTTGPKSIPVRPRTPLRFGSVPTPLPVDPAIYNKRPIRNLYANLAIADSVTSILSQESYLLYPPSPPSLSPTAPENISSLASSSSSAPNRFLCPDSSCEYSVIGFHAREDLEFHFYADPAHAVAMDYLQPMQQAEVPCSCPHCSAYQEWPCGVQQQASYSFQQQNQQTQMSPMAVGYGELEVGNLNWDGERIPKMGGSYPVQKRRRVEFLLNP